MRTTSRFTRGLYTMLSAVMFICRWPVEAFVDVLSVTVRELGPTIQTRLEQVYHTGRKLKAAFQAKAPQRKLTTCNQARSHVAMLRSRGELLAA
ncbi:MAG: hypothetical protein Q8L20_10855 [Gammaproteobacteria bacterium]|nr:hypothetical protein [Gammaproteobacteria bacterium]